MIEKEITVAADKTSLAGTLCLPEPQGVFPLVLMVHGSGPTDRNENVKGLALNIFNQTAHFLAQQGIASYRYDKRGVGSSGGDFDSTGHADLVRDAKSCLEHLLTLSECDSSKVFVLGHSEGSIIAPQLSQQSDKVAGIILLAPFIDNMESILHKQATIVEQLIDEMTGLKRLPLKLFFKIARPGKTQAKLIHRVKTEQKDVIRMQFQKIGAKWLRELLELDPQAIYQKTIVPCLVIGGDKDLQCDPGDVQRIVDTVAGPAESHVITDMTHILRLDPGKPTLFNYNELAREPVETRVLELITRWVTEKSQSKL